MTPRPEPLVITLATRNEGKRRDLSHWAENSGFPVTLVVDPDAAEIEETGRSFLENARLKAQGSRPVTPGGLVLAEDSGLVVDALDGSFGISSFPGIYSNRWLTPALRDALADRIAGQPSIPALVSDRLTEAGIRNDELCRAILALMAGKADRAARYCCGMALWRADQGLLFETLDTTELRVIDGAPRGVNGFGYDPIMQPVDDTGRIEPCTMAELSLPEKNRISHRGRAFAKVLAFLQIDRLVETNINK
jgi:XTP/dITP diphosphohydrolase